ncbi:hypothetical protein [Allocoleopsis sp.]|uniref:hypothetical protein n=1 Tax=Allocoleopsis sp. TaxID=3088169 RepID=UPI002FD0E475
MKKNLSEYFRLNRRYSRSINLERDLELPNTVEGYVLTERAVDTLLRIVAALTGTQSTRAWTLTGVYGTGKSAFAHYLASLCAPATNPMRHTALNIAAVALGSDSSEYRTLEANLPERGVFRAVATSQREPLSHTIIRALERGAGMFWQGTRPQLAIARELENLVLGITCGDTSIDSRNIPSLVQEVAQAAQTPVLLIIDELGKNLEFAAANQGDEDLYLLQQLTELSQKDGSQVYLVGLLHSSFAEYSQRLASKERNEWQKIHGRFEDIPFDESAGQMMRLIGEAIDRSQAAPFHSRIHEWAEEWFEYLPRNITNDLTPKVLADAYPLHPIAAMVLPMLCIRYAQNDRSLFTFLTSDEPLSFKNLLKEETVEENALPTLKLHRIYDYFIESVGMGLASRPNLQRWLEVQSLIADARHLDSDSLQVLKTIGTLNLVTATGALRATRSLVTLAMCEQASDHDQLNRWQQVIDNLREKGLITHLRQLDELRIWEGSDFDVEGEIDAIVETQAKPLASLLSAIFPLHTLVAQRHSYKTGTLRYFERQYLDASNNLETLHCTNNNCDGLIGYWLDEALPTTKVPAQTADGKPLIVLGVTKLDVLRIRALEFAALQKIKTSAPQLQTDAVARREVEYRLGHAKRLLDESLKQAFDVAINQNVCWIQGKQETISHVTDFNTKLSEVCDEIYPDGLKLWNELINRRELTSQGAKARRELIEAMLEHPEQERLGLQGNGPEVSMYDSLLGKTGIHRQEKEEWGFHPPLKDSGVLSVWQAINDFCLQAKEKTRNLDLLYKHLESPPYGVKRGAIPVLLAAVLLHHVDDVGVYKDGTFIPVLGAEHFELLVKDQSRFSVKYFEVAGLRAQVFKELEDILKKPNERKPSRVRNTTLIEVVKPLLQFVKKLPAYTTKTQSISNDAKAVLQTLENAQEPDELLFTSLPQACGLEPIVADEADDGTKARTLKYKLIQSLNEIQTAYERLLNECETRLHDAFGVPSSETKLRENLRVRANYLVGKCLKGSLLDRFTKAATDETVAKREWLEALLMIVADRPVVSWTDQDVAGFEIKLTDIARQFKNLETLIRTKVDNSTNKGFDARLLTLTYPDGKEKHELVWIDQNRQNQILEDLGKEILEKPILRDNPQLQQALAAKFTESVLGSAPQDNVDQIQAKRKNRKYEQETG